MDFSPKVIRESVQEISIDKYNLNNDNIKIFHKIISKCNKLNMLKLRYCGTPEDLNSFLSKLGDTDCEIVKIHVWGVENVNIYCKSLFSLVKKAKTKTLVIHSVNLQQIDIVEMKNVVIKIANECLQIFDLSYNSSMSDFKTLAEIVKLLPVTNFTLFNCYLTDENVGAFFQNLDGKKIKHLDISGNINITARGFEVIGKWIESLETLQLSIRCCDITQDKLISLLKSCHKKIEIRMLDVSYNASLGVEGMEALGVFGIEFKVKDLRMSGCSLNNELMQRFVESMRTTEKASQLRALNVSDNHIMHEGTIHVASLINLSPLLSVDMSNCRLLCRDVKEFKNNLDKHARIELLNLSETDRVLEQEYAELIADLIPHTSNMLILKFPHMETSIRNIFEQKLGNMPSKSRPTLVFEGDIVR